MSLTNTMTATRERIERIAREHMGKPLTESDAVAHLSCIQALTALYEEMEREKQRSSLDRNSSKHKNCDSTCQECT